VGVRADRPEATVRIALTDQSRPRKTTPPSENSTALLTLSHTSTADRCVPGRSSTGSSFDHPEGATQ
jgi:hypothetical protein